MLVPEVNRNHLSKTRGADKLTTRIHMLERWQLSGSDLVDDAFDARVRRDVGLDKGDSLGGADVLDQLIG